MNTAPCSHQVRPAAAESPVLLTDACHSVPAAALGEVDDIAVDGEATEVGVLPGLVGLSGSGAAATG